MKVYCMADIHGCMEALEQALLLVVNHLKDRNTVLLFLGDYIDGPEDRAVLDRIMGLQKTWGKRKVLALMGNHEECVLEGFTGLFQREDVAQCSPEDLQNYMNWIRHLPRYCMIGRTIFVHAGIEETAGEFWIQGTEKHTFTEKYPAQTGKFWKEYKIVAGHIGTHVLAGDPDYHDIYYDGESHYYIDGSVLVSGTIPVMLADTAAGKYYRVTETGMEEIRAYSRHPAC